MKNPKSMWPLAAVVTAGVGVAEAATVLHLIPGTTVVDTGALLFTGFLADNRLVRTMGLTHPQMARPLYQTWNMILQEIESGALGRFSNVQHFLYHGRKIALRAEGMKGWQISIFQDEIQGRFDIDAQRILAPLEKRFLQDKYSHLSDTQIAELEERLTHLHFSEMAPYYIMRYGFYEGHTKYRADPIAIACLFGLKTIEEIEDAFRGSLYGALTNHFMEEKS